MLFRHLRYRSILSGAARLILPVSILIQNKSNRVIHKIHISHDTIIPVPALCLSVIHLGQNHIAIQNCRHATIFRRICSGCKLHILTFQISVRHTIQSNIITFIPTAFNHYIYGNHGNHINNIGQCLQFFNGIVVQMLIFINILIVFSHIVIAT